MSSNEVSYRLPLQNLNATNSAFGRFHSNYIEFHRLFPGLKNISELIGPGLKNISELIGSV